MSIREWFHHLINPHCPVCEEQSEKPCLSCETLRHQLELANINIDKLINRLTSTPEITLKESTEQIPIKPRFTPWRVRRQMLEEEDRRAAQIMRQKQEELTYRPVVEPNKIDGVEIAPADDPDVIELEREMGIIEKEREDASGVR